MSHTSILTHIVFRTKSSVPAIIPEHSHMLYRYIWGMVKHRRSVLLRINGMPDHVHLFVELNPSIALSEFVGAIKATTSRWMKDSGKFPLFTGWAREYAAFSYAARDKHTIISYIKNQQAHHQKVCFSDEIKTLYAEFGLEESLPYFLRDED